MGDRPPKSLTGLTKAPISDSCCVFLGGAVGVEMSTDWYDDQGLLNTLAYNLWTAVEEGMEMGGVVLFIYALLRYMGRGQGARVDVIVEGQNG